MFSKEFSWFSFSTHMKICVNLFWLDKLHGKASERLPFPFDVAETFEGKIILCFLNKQTNVDTKISEDFVG